LYAIYRLLIRAIMTKQTEPEFFSKQITDAKRFYIQKSSKITSRLEVICGGCEHTIADYKINRKDFPYYCIELVTKGNGTAILQDQSCELKSGTIFTYGPGISQKISAAYGESMVKYFIDFTGSNGRELIDNYISPLGTSINIDRPDEIVATFNNLLGQGLSESPYKSITCSLLLEYLIYQIAGSMVCKPVSRSRAYITYQQCRQYIKSNFILLNSLEDIANACMIDASYMCRLFKRFDTQTPYQYLLNLKMTYAADEFRQTNIFVKEMAYKLGFSDPFHFTRTFKKFFGVCPQTFKNLR
jgi:AraC-like DNA-binding protein